MLITLFAYAKMHGKIRSSLGRTGGKAPDPSGQGADPEGTEPRFARHSYVKKNRRYGFTHTRRHTY